MSHKSYPIPQPNPQPPFQWNQLTPDQQSQLSHLLARLLTPYLATHRPIAQQEVPHEQPSQNR